VQTTVVSAGPGFIVRTRQQPFEAFVAAKTNVTPAGSALGPDSGSDSVSIEDDVQARSEIDITKQGNVDRRILSMQTILERAPSRTRAHLQRKRGQVVNLFFGSDQGKEAAGTTPADMRYTLWRPALSRACLVGAEGLEPPTFSL
jgi:hypothetical protein